MQWHLPVQWRWCRVSSAWWFTSARLAHAQDSLLVAGRHETGADGRSCGRIVVIRRDQRIVAQLCAPLWRAYRPQPGNDRIGCREPGVGAISRVPPEQQRLTHPGCAGSRVTEPADLCGGCRGGGRTASGRPRPAAPSSHERAGGHHHLRRLQSVRNCRTTPHLPDAEMGILAVACLFGRRDCAGRHSGNRIGGRHGSHRVPVGWLEALLRHTRQGPPSETDITISNATRKPVRYPG